MVKEHNTTDLIRALGEARSRANQTGRSLHDEVAPLLTAAGLRLQLVQMDHPEATAGIHEALAALEQANEQIRRMSQCLAPSLVYRLGLEAALRKMVEDKQPGFGGFIGFRMSPGVKLEPELGAILYDALDSLLRMATARKGVTKVRLSISGTKRACARLEFDGEGPAKPPHGVAVRLAEYAGFTFAEATRKGTIVFALSYGIPRSSRRRS